MNGSGRWWWNCRAQQQVALILLVVLSGLARGAAAKHILERDSVLYEGDTCELRNGSTGICQTASQCDWVLGQPLSVQELVTCSVNQSIPIICCPVQVKPQLTTTVGKRPSIFQCEKYSVSRHPMKSTIGGEAQYGNFPYMVALGFGMPNSSDANASILFRCRASLISPSYLLTVAHCLRERPVFARFGVLEQQPENSVDPPLDIAIKKMIPHPGYQNTPLQHDVALLELEEPINSTWPYVQPVCLYPNTTESGSFDSKYTLSRPRYDTNSSLLMKASVTIIGHKECNSIMPRTRRLPFGVFPGLLCALGRNEKNEMTGYLHLGDSGGPLELNIDSQHYLVGIASLGSSYDSVVQAIYIEVAHYLDWIESIVWPDL